MGKTLTELEFEFFSSQYESIRILKDTSKVRVELVYYEPKGISCVLKTYFGRNLSDVYERLKNLHHENLTVVYDAVWYQGNTYVLEEMISGVTLKEYLEEKGTFSEAETVRMMTEICHGLSLLHHQRPPLIHRDLKPGNVMLREDGTVKLIDFDTVREVEQGKDQDTVLLGTEEYASPEHYGYGQTGPASDIYSLGVMMNELLTGQVLVGHEATAVGRLRPVIDRCIKTDPKERFSSVRELERAMAFSPGEKKKRKWPGILMGVGILVLALAAVGAPGDTERALDEKKPAQETRVLESTGKENTEAESKVTQEAGTLESTAKWDAAAAKASEAVGETQEDISAPEGEGSDSPSASAVHSGNQQSSYSTGLSSFKKPEGELLSMAGTKSGIYYTVSDRGEGVFLETSDGRTKDITYWEGRYFNNGELSYNHVADCMYLFRTTGDDLLIFQLDQDLEPQLKLHLSNEDLDYAGYQKLSSCGYFSDGMMLCGFGGNLLIDTNTWNVAGKIPGGRELKVIHDEIYLVGDEIAKVDFQGNIMETYDVLPGSDIAYAQGYPGTRFYSDGQAIYYAKDDGIYRFDGRQESCEVDLTTLTYFTRMDYQFLTVTDTGIRYYDWNTEDMKEIRKE